MNMNMVLYYVIIFAVFGGIIFFMNRSQKKKQKKEEEAREAVQVGDEIITIGGFYGRVMAIKDDSIVIESLADHSKQRIVKGAIQTNLTVHDAAPKK